MVFADFDVDSVIAQIACSQNVLFVDFDVDNGILPYMTYMATMHMLVKNEHMQDRRARPVHIIHSGHLEGQRSTYNTEGPGQYT